MKNIRRTLLALCPGCTLCGGSGVAGSGTCPLCGGTGQCGSGGH